MDKPVQIAPNCQNIVRFGIIFFVSNWICITYLKSVRKELSFPTHP